MLSSSHLFHGQAQPKLHGQRRCPLSKACHGQIAAQPPRHAFGPQGHWLQQVVAQPPTGVYNLPLVFFPVPMESVMIAANAEPLTKCPTQIEKVPVADGVMIITQADPLSECCNQSKEVIEKLNAGTPEERHNIVVWLTPVALDLAQHQEGCRTAQAAIEHAAGADRDGLLQQFRGRVEFLYKSHSGNFVLSKLVETMPPTKVDFIVEYASSKWHTCKMAKHKYGSRVLQTLIQHCPVSQLAGMYDELLKNAVALSRDAFANFVIQAMLEHAESYRRPIVENLLPQIGKLAMNRGGSYVIRQVFQYCDEACLQNVAAALRQAEQPHSFEDISKDRFGESVVKCLSESC